MHVNAISKRASTKIFVLRQLKPFLTVPELVTIYNNCIRSILEYCAPLFVGLNSTLANIIENVQSRSHRIICGSSQCNCAYFVPLSYRRLMIGASLFKCMVNNEDHVLHHLVPKKIKYSRKYCMPECSLVLRRNCFILTMIRLFNSGFCS